MFFFYTSSASVFGHAPCSRATIINHILTLVMRDQNYVESFEKRQRYEKCHYTDTAVLTIRISVTSHELRDSCAKAAQEAYHTCSLEGREGHGTEITNPRRYI